MRASGSVAPVKLVRLLVITFVLAACSTPEAPAELALVGSVAVAEVGGAAVTVDQAWVEANAASGFTWGEGRAWRLAPLFSERWSADGVELLVTGAPGEAVVYSAPGKRADGREPVLIVNKKGEALVMLAVPAATESFHGRGGARSRGPDTSPRIVGVTRIELRPAP